MEGIFCVNSSLVTEVTLCPGAWVLQEIWDSKIVTTLRKTPTLKRPVIWSFFGSKKTSNSLWSAGVNWDSPDFQDILVYHFTPGNTLFQHGLFSVFVFHFLIAQLPSCRNQLLFLRIFWLVGWLLGFFWNSTHKILALNRNGVFSWHVFGIAEEMYC